MKHLSYLRRKSKGITLGVLALFVVYLCNLPGTSSLCLDADDVIRKDGTSVVLDTCKLMICLD